MAETAPPMWIEIEEDPNAYYRSYRWRWVIRRTDHRMPFGFATVRSGSARTRDKAEAAARKEHAKVLAWYARQQERIDL